MTTPASDFDAAKAITDQLKGMEKERQERILRWVAESLALAVGSTRPAPLPGTASAPEHIRQYREHRDMQEGHRAPNIKTFVDSKKPKSDVQFAAVVAYYYRFEALESQKETIDAKTLQDAARLAGRRRPPSALTTLNNAKSLGYLDAPTRGQFQINTVGENLVAMTLPGGGEERNRRGARRNAKRSKQKPGKR